MMDIVTLGWVHRTRHDEESSDMLAAMVLFRDLQAGGT